LRVLQLRQLVCRLIDAPYVAQVYTPAGVGILLASVPVKKFPLDTEPPLRILFLSESQC
jgi:hypothetical protein